MTLTEFLLARVAEDEAEAQAASPGPWYINPNNFDQVLAVDGIEVTDAYALSGRQQQATAVHIARHNPARVLAECEAKQRIVALHAPIIDIEDSPGACGLCQWDGDCGVGTDDWPCPTLRVLTLPYADHPDYQEAWRQ